MSSAPRARRLSAVLFLDVVGSTQIASDLGDRRWRELLTRFRRTVRALLKRYDGREEDTAGDGFFATFPAPEQAVRAADAIVRAVQVHGIDVRCGVHFGECEEVDGRLAGIAVHIASRVMSLAGPAEVQVTSTVRDLVAGSGLAFEDLSAHELKGVPGTWQLFALRELEGDPAAAPLTGAQAAGRLAEVTPPSAARRRIPVAAWAATLLVVGAAVWFLLSRGDGDGHTTPTATARTGPVATGESPGSPSPVQLSQAVVKLDRETGEVQKQVPDVIHGGLGGTRYMAFGEGAVWVTGNGLARIDQATGEIERTGVGGGNVAVGDHEVWVATASGSNGKFQAAAARIDPVTARVIDRLVYPGTYGSLLAKVAVGAGYVWMAYQDQLGQADSGHGDPVLVHGVPEGAHVDLVTAYGEQVWVTDFLNGFLYQVDPDRSAIKTTVELQVAPDAIAVGPAGLWVVSTSGRIAFEVDEESGVPDSPIPVGDGPVAVAVGTHTVWVANRDDDTVTRIDTETNTPTAIPVPGSPIALAVDPRTDAVWVYLI